MNKPPPIPSIVSSAFLLALAVLAMSFLAAQPLQAGAFSLTGSLGSRRGLHSATLLSNGKVLIAGGSSNTVVLASAELYDPATGKWTLTGPMNTARRTHTASMLPNAKVLVAGGSGGSTLSSAELYDPATGNWALTGPLSSPRSAHTATVLPNGQVLVAGGYSGSSQGGAELYDPATGAWTVTGSLNTPRHAHTATLMPSGQVLVTGGYNTTNGTNALLASAELYDPATGTWESTAPLANARYLHTATLLPNGEVLVAGGSKGLVNGSVSLASAELFDPAAGTWATAGSLAGARDYHSATLLPNGQVLVTGGESNGTWVAYRGTLQPGHRGLDESQPAGEPAPIPYRHVAGWRASLGCGRVQR